MRVRSLAASAAVAAALSLSLAGTARAADKNCSDFPTQAAAQAAYNADPSDPNHLDADKDGIACENLAGGSESVVTQQQVGATPVGIPAGDGSTAHGDSTLPVALGGLTLVAAGGAAFAARRSARTAG